MRAAIYARFPTLSSGGQILPRENYAKCRDPHLHFSHIRFQSAATNTYSSPLAPKTVFGIRFDNASEIDDSRVKNAILLQICPGVLGCCHPHDGWRSACAFLSRLFLRDGARFGTHVFKRSDGLSNGAFLLQESFPRYWSCGRGPNSQFRVSEFKLLYRLRGPRRRRPYSGNRLSASIVLRFAAALRP